MLNIGLSHPNSFLPTLAFTVLTLPNVCLAADSHATSTRPSNGVLNVDVRLLSALLTPVSHLVPSPYADQAAAENPLRVERKPSAVPEAKADVELLSVSSAVRHTTYESYATNKPYKTLPAELSMESPVNVNTPTEPLIGAWTVALIQR